MKENDWRDILSISEKSTTSFRTCQCSNGFGLFVCPDDISFISCESIFGKNSIGPRLGSEFSNVK